MSTDPVEQARGLLYFTDGSLVHTGHYRHEGVHPDHTHSFVEIAVVLGGEGTHRSLAGPQRLRTGDVLMLRPGVWHGYEQCTALRLFNCCISAEVLHRELAWTREDPLLGYLLWSGPYVSGRRGMLTTHLPDGELRDCVTHLEALAELREHPIPAHRADIIGRLSLLLGTLARAVAAQRPEEAEAIQPAHPAVAQAMRLMESDFARPWTLHELSEALHLTPTYLVRLFTSTAGLPPIAYLSRHRAETAAAMLLHTDAPITQVARSVGWSDQNYFARRFRSHYGMSATAYRTKFRHSTRHLA